LSSVAFVCGGGGLAGRGGEPRLRGDLLVEDALGSVELCLRRRLRLELGGELRLARPHGRSLLLLGRRAGRRRHPREQGDGQEQGEKWSRSRHTGRFALAANGEATTDRNTTVMSTAGHLPPTWGDRPARTSPNGPAGRVQDGM
jgi:hypothetical protein